MAKYCMKCGTSLPDEALFCSKCGSRQFQAAQKENANADTYEESALYSQSRIKETPRKRAPLPPVTSVKEARRPALKSLLFLIFLIGFLAGGAYLAFLGASSITSPSGFSKQITISNTGAELTDYQVLITTDTSSLISAEKMRPDCGDVRFMDSNRITSLNYWTEDCNAGKFWVNVPSIPATGTAIYIYYGDSLAKSASDMDATFIASDLTKFSKVDANNRVIINNASMATFTKLPRNEDIYLYKKVAPILDYRFDFEYIVTGGSSTPDNDAYIRIGGLADSSSSLNKINNGLFINNYDAFHISAYRLYMNRRLDDAESMIPQGDNYASISSDKPYYVTITRLGTTVSMNVYSDAARTIHVRGSPRTDTVSPVVSFDYVLPITSFFDGNTVGYASGYIQNMRVRKYASPEPVASIGAEEHSKSSINMLSVVYLAVGLIIIAGSITFLRKKQSWWEVVVTTKKIIPDSDIIRWIEDQLEEGFSAAELKAYLKECDQNASLVDKCLAIKRTAQTTSKPSSVRSPEKISTGDDLGDIQKGTSDFYIRGAKAGAVAGAIDGVIGTVIGGILTSVMLPIIAKQFSSAMTSSFGIVGGMYGAAAEMGMAAGLAQSATASGILSGAITSLIYGAIWGVVFGTLICFGWDWPILGGRTPFMRALIARAVLFAVTALTAISAALLLPFGFIALIAVPAIVSGLVSVLIYAKLFDRFLKHPIF